MNRRVLGELRAEFPGASWALWSPEFPESGCVEEQSGRLTEFIEDRSTQLNGRVVLLSVNPSERRSLGYQNFHTPARDDAGHRLKQYIQDQELQRITGAYIAELTPKVRDPDPSGLAPQDADTERFLDQLHSLGHRRYDVVCLGADVFRILDDRFTGDPESRGLDIQSFTAKRNDIELDVHCLATPSNGQLARQLEYCNNEILDR